MPHLDEPSPVDLPVPLRVIPPLRRLDVTPGRTAAPRSRRQRAPREARDTSALTAVPSPGVGTTSDLADVVARTSGRMLPEPALARLLELVTATAVQVVPRACGAGVTVAAPAAEHGAPPGLRFVTTAGTDALVEHLDRRQDELDEGPCLTAWAGRTVVRVDDLRTDPRWPRWSTEACGTGVRSVLSAPLVAGDHPLGALKLYAHVPAAFGDADERAAAMFAAQASVVLSAAAEVRRAGALDADLRDLLHRREVLSQATGIVMARDRVHASGALAHLVALSRRDARSVHDVAQRLVAGVTRGL